MKRLDDFQRLLDVALHVQILKRPDARYEVHATFFGKQTYTTRAKTLDRAMEMMLGWWRIDFSDEGRPAPREPRDSRPEWRTSDESCSSL